MPEPSAAAVRFHRSGLWLWVFAQAWSIAVPLAVVASGLATRIRDRAERWSPWRPGSVAIAAVLFLAVLFLANLPLRFYAGYVRLHEYGLSEQPFDRWLGHAVMRLGILMATTAVILPGPYYLIRRAPRRWCLYVGLISVPIAAFFAWVMPIVIDPLFHDFRPLDHPELAARIDALARRANIVGATIEQVEMSRDTTTVNAYVTGLLGSKRIVLWDTLLDRFEDDQILAIVGHEMGHYVLNHVALGVCLSAFATIAGLFVLDRAARALLRRVGPRLGIGGLDDVAALPLAYAIGLAILLASDPISFAVSRSMEHEADRFALEITRDNHAAASAFLNLQRHNLSVPYPDPFTRIWRSSHPALGDRIEFCNDYHPWSDGRPLKYGGLFRDP
ncbi:M48 family metallopeptidase [Tundrisphaera sp. TA3]|uniref:M48 family metallopeptidase n=1 Tax=Tundrisphaera sp. TA3 TaxID=3435775 RepID=UPI003EB7B181